jgi:hypothetical protein
MRAHTGVRPYEKHFNLLPGEPQVHDYKYVNNPDQGNPFTGAELERLVIFVKQDVMLRPKKSPGPTGGPRDRSGNK